MAGHSKFANIKHRKNAQDSKRAKLFTRLQREILIAAKAGGINPEFNPSLRNAIINARSNNMPNDKIDSAIKKADSDNNMDNYFEMTYEGYGPYKTAIIIEILTDNKNRTAGDIRSIITKSGGNLGASGSTAFLFEHVGIIKYKKNNILYESIFEYSIEIGASDVIEEDEFYLIKTEIKDFKKILDDLYDKFKEPISSEIIYIAKDYKKLDQDQLEKFIILINKLEDHDDVNRVFSDVILPS